MEAMHSKLLPMTPACRVMTPTCRMMKLMHSFVRLPQSTWHQRQGSSSSYDDDSGNLSKHRYRFRRSVVKAESKSLPPFSTASINYVTLLPSVQFLNQKVLD